MTITLGFDVGTSRTKALVYDTNERLVLACVSEETPVKAGTRGDLRDADEIWAVLAKLCHRLIDAGAPLQRVSGVSLASLGEEIVFLDERGLPTAPVSCWYVAQPADAVEGEDLPQFRLAGWYAIRAAKRREEPALSTAISFTDLGSSLLTRLVGARQPHMDRSHASRTGLLDNVTGKWSLERLHGCGAENLQPPMLVDSGTYVGALDPAAAALMALPSGVPVYSGAHDHMCAALAAGAKQSGDVFVSVGTSESRLVLVDMPWRELSSREEPGREVGFFADGRHGYLHTSSPSGLRVAEIVSNDQSGRDINAVYKALADMVSVDSDGSLTLSVGAYESDPCAAELFVELDRQASQSAAAIAEMTELIGGNTLRITIIGVPTQHEVWRRIRSQHSDHPLEFIEVEELSAIGAALLAAGIAREAEA